MQWLVDLFQTDSIAHAVLILSLVAACGLALGSIRFRGISLGIAGVLFAGLAFGHFGALVNEEVLEFAREFGLILFVYTIGLQVGPGFLASLRRQGLGLNLMAAAVVLLGVAVTLGIYFLGMDRGDFPVAVGLFSGATTNTPSLAAAQQALKDVPGLSADAGKLPGVGYAVAYPFGVLGIILVVLLTRRLFRIDLQEETRLLAELNPQSQQPLATMNLEVKNPNLDKLPLGQVPTINDQRVVISRVLHQGQTLLARPDTLLHLGDVLLAVGLPERLEELRVIVGAQSPVDIRALPSNITARRLLVTRSQALGNTIEQLELPTRFGVTVTRVHRAEIELPPSPGVRLQFGDSIVVVGQEQALTQVAAEVGDLPKSLSHPQIIPIFVGIALGVILGSWPFHFPGMPAAVKLGLAGGPLLVAILLSRLGNIGPLVWYMPISANFILREIGIVLFLGCVGLRAGDRFVQTLVDGPGLYWMACGAAITLLPLLIVALFARWVYKLNFLSLCGLLAGSMTDPPALAFTTMLTNSDAPSISYATVYPLVMLLRVLCAQAMVLFFFQ